jgi:hypothetical protein
MQYADLVLKIIILFFLAATSELAFKKRKWGLMLLALAVWITFFRTAILRAISLYTGVFNGASEFIVNNILNFFMQGLGLIITDIIILLGTLLAFLIVAEGKKYD